jgi:hypothetical protein
MDEKRRDLSSCGSDDIDSGLLGCDAVWSCRLEAVRSSKMLVITCKTTWCHNLRAPLMKKEIYREI